MAHIVRFFTCRDNVEDFLKEYYYATTPILPREKEMVCIEGELYTVKKICVCYDMLSCPDKQTVEIMLDDYDNYFKEWWE